MPGLRSSLLITLLCALLAPPTHAETFRVEPNTNWSHLQPRPGDIIELLPGQHRPVSLSGTSGREDAPIVIRKPPAF